VRGIQSELVNVRGGCAFTIVGNGTGAFTMVGNGVRLRRPFQKALSMVVYGDIRQTLTSLGHLRRSFTAIVDGGSLR
jgi:hypothetical protein